jgi:hypothetical protein
MITPIAISAASGKNANQASEKLRAAVPPLDTVVGEAEGWLVVVLGRGAVAAGGVVPLPGEGAVEEDEASGTALGSGRTPCCW